ncbi:hypothetical protein BDW69DRAFT_177490 [Aspergillus filifer]
MRRSICVGFLKVGWMVLGSLGGCGGCGGNLDLDLDLEAEAEDANRAVAGELALASLMCGKACCRARNLYGA